MSENMADLFRLDMMHARLSLEAEQRERDDASTRPAVPDGLALCPVCRRRVGVKPWPTDAPVLLRLVGHRHRGGLCAGSSWINDRESGVSGAKYFHEP